MWLMATATACVHLQRWADVRGLTAARRKACAVALALPPCRAHAPCTPWVSCGQHPLMVTAVTLTPAAVDGCSTIRWTVSGAKVWERAWPPPRRRTVTRRGGTCRHAATPPCGSRRWQQQQRCTSWTAVWLPRGRMWRPRMACLGCGHPARCCPACRHPCSARPTWTACAVRQASPPSCEHCTPLPALPPPPHPPTSCLSACGGRGTAGARRRCHRRRRPPNLLPPGALTCRRTWRRAPWRRWLGSPRWWRACRHTRTPWRQRRWRHDVLRCHRCHFHRRRRHAAVAVVPAGGGAARRRQQRRRVRLRPHVGVQQLLPRWARLSARHQPSK